MQKQPAYYTVVKEYPGAQFLAESAFTRKAVELEQQYKNDQARLKEWNDATQL